MIEGRRFRQQDYQNKMVRTWQPYDSAWMVNYIKHSTILFIKTVVVRRLTNDGWGTSWAFTVPSGADQLIGHLFDMSLNNTIIDYCIGRNIYSDNLRENIYADVITLVEAKNGYTNITPTLIDAMSQRYEK